MSADLRVAAILSTSESPPSFPLADADLCVKCGLCLPHCPTYGDARNEADSPRGRIMLMQGMATARIVPSVAVERHLDGCLGCRACEKVCPAQVPYGALIDAGRALLGRERPVRLRGSRRLSRLLSSAAGRAVLRALLRGYTASGVQAIVRRFRLLGRGRLARLEATLPKLTAQPQRAALARADPRPTVQLFAGCVGDIAERAVAADLARLLADCGHALAHPPGQTCCGAIDQHAGDALRAARLAARNVAAFASPDDAPILALATGCAATLADYPRLAAEGGAAFAARLRDPIAFLLAHGERLRFRPTPLTVAIHEPCTQRNVIGEGAALRALLARVPALKIVELDPAGRCCGAAGTHFVSHPDAADALLAPKLEAAARLAPDVIVSANIGCSLHLAGGLRRQGGISPEVLHPVQLLARCRA